jgi:GNAT superfamily N-acetyltransferase
MTAHISQIDTQRFGFGIARIDDPVILRSPDTIPALKQQHVRLIITRIHSSRLEVVNALEDLGFRIKDMQVTWRSSPGQPPWLPPPDPRFRIRNAIPADSNAFRIIAGNAFDNYGHYFADQRLDREVCRLIYPDWAARTLAESIAAQHKIFVATAGEEVTGFAAFQLAGGIGDRHAACIIGAVAPAWQGQQIYSSLIAAAGSWVTHTGLAWQEHNTLTTNYPVNNVLARLGFRQVQAFMTLHCWLDG